MNVQIIKNKNQPLFAVIPYEDYLAMLQHVEDANDILAANRVKERIAEGEETVPAKIVYAILSGENPVRLWREHRGLAQQMLAEQVGISNAYLSQIESGARSGDPVLEKIAVALGVSAEDLRVENIGEQ